MTHLFPRSIRSDAIIRSADDVDFYVLSSIIAFASPVLEKMLHNLELGTIQPPDPQSDSDLDADKQRLPILELSEGGRTLALLLQLCYPTPDPAVDTKGLHGIRELYEAATKYDVPRAAAFAKQTCRAALDICPQRVYFIAARFGWDDLMDEAAWRTVYDLSDHYDPAMDSVPASVYRRLLVYRQKCRKVISSRCVLDFDVPEEDRNRGGLGPLRERSLYWCAHEPWLFNSGETKYWMSVHGKVREGELLSLMETDAVFPEAVVEFVFRNSTTSGGNTSGRRPGGWTQCRNAIMDIARGLSEVRLSQTSVQHPAH